MNTLTFNGNTLTAINQDNQIWLTSADVAKALGYKNTKSISNLYSNNSDEFTDQMTLVIESVTNGINGSKRRMAVRIFSLRGCHLLAMFARTDIAKAFRVWVLDILERETKTAASQRTPLRKACDRLAVGNMLISDAYKIVTSHYNVEHIDQIPESKLPEAVAFVYDVILARQAGSTDNSKYIDDMHGLGRKKVEETRHAIGVIKKALASLDCGIEVVRQHNETQFSVFESLKSQTARVVK